MHVRRHLPWLIALPAWLIVIPSSEDEVAVPGFGDDAFVHTGTIAGADPSSGEFPADIVTQVHQAIANLEARLAKVDLDLSHVVSMNVYLADTRHFSAMNEVYRSYFASDPPTRATVGVDLRENGSLIEVAAVAARPHVERSVINPPGLKSPALPYSWGVLAGNTLFVAGATSRDPNTYAPLTGDIAAQTRRVWGNIRMVLEAADMNAADLAQCRVFLADPRDFGAMNRAYREAVTENPPGRATVWVDLMNPDFKVEIQCTAERGANRRVVVAEGRRRSRAPLSPGIMVNNRVYLSGMLGRGPEGYARIQDQTTRTLNNLRATLSAADLSFADVHDVHVYLPDIRYTRVVDSIVATVVSPDVGMTVVGAGLVSTGALVEIMMTAGRE